MHAAWIGYTWSPPPPVVNRKITCRVPFDRTGHQPGPAPFPPLPMTAPMAFALSSSSSSAWQDSAAGKKQY